MLEFFKNIFRKLKSSMNQEKYLKRYGDLINVFRRVTPLEINDLSTIEGILKDLIIDPTTLNNLERKMKILREALRNKKKIDSGRLQLDTVDYNRDVTYCINGTIVYGEVESEQETKYFSKDNVQILNSRPLKPKVCDFECAKNECKLCLERRLRMEISRNFELEQQATKKRKISSRVVKDLNEQLGLPSTFGRFVADEKFNLEDLEENEKREFVNWKSEQKGKTDLARKTLNLEVPIRVESNENPFGNENKLSTEMNGNLFSSESKLSSAINGNPFGSESKFSTEMNGNKSNSGMNGNLFGSENKLVTEMIGNPFGNENKLSSEMISDKFNSGINDNKLNSTIIRNPFGMATSVQNNETLLNEPSNIFGQEIKKPNNSFSSDPSNSLFSNLSKTPLNPEIKKNPEEQKDVDANLPVASLFTTKSDPSAFQSKPLALPFTLELDKSKVESNANIFNKPVESKNEKSSVFPTESKAFTSDLKIPALSNPFGQKPSLFTVPVAGENKDKSLSNLSNPFAKKENSSGLLDKQETLSNTFASNPINSVFTGSEPAKAQFNSFSNSEAIKAPSGNIQATNFEPAKNPFGSSAFSSSDMIKNPFAKSVPVEGSQNPFATPVPIEGSQNPFAKSEPAKNPFGSSFDLKQDLTKTAFPSNPFSGSSKFNFSESANSLPSFTPSVFNQSGTSNSAFNQPGTSNSGFSQSGTSNSVFNQSGTSNSGFNFGQPNSNPFAPPSSNPFSSTPCQNPFSPTSTAGQPQSQTGFQFIPNNFSNQNVFQTQNTADEAQNSIFNSNDDSSDPTRKRKAFRRK